VLPRQRPDVDDVVGLHDRGLVVLDHHEGVPEVAQPDQGVDQPLVVALMQADRWLVQDVEDADEAAPDLGRETDPLRLAAGERAGRPAQGEVVEADVDQEPQAFPDLLQEALGDHRFALGQADALDEGEGPADRAVGELGDVQAVDRHREGLRPQAPALAGAARDLAHELLELLALGLRLGLGVTPIHVRDHALEGRVVRALPSVAVLVLHVHLLVGAVEEHVAGPFRELLPGSVERDVLGVGHGLEDAVPVFEGGARPRGEGAVAHGEVGIGHHELGVDLEPRPEPVAGRARAVRGVEREVPRSELLEGEAAVRAGQVLREGLQLLVALVRGDRDRGDPGCELEGGLDRVGHATADPRLRDEAVHDDLDRVLVGLREPYRLRELAHLAVDPRPREPLASEILEQLAVLPLPAPDDGREHLELRPLGELEDLVDDLVGRLAPDRTATVVAVRVADPRVQHPEVVVDLGDRAHGGSRVARGGLLVDRDRR